MAQHYTDHDITPRHSVDPLGRITLPVTFGDPFNFRTEQLQFEVVDFLGAVVFERPCYIKFMAVPNYTYLKLKMPGPCGIITTSTTFQTAYACERANRELATALAATRELAEL